MSYVVSEIKGSVLGGRNVLKGWFEILRIMFSSFWLLFSFSLNVYVEE